MKTSNPYKANDTYKVAPETITSELSKASGKAKARYPHSPLGVNQSNGQAGKMKGRAFTPGGPAGS